jgi:hypothetical protein
VAGRRQRVQQAGQLLGVAGVRQRGGPLRQGLPGGGRPVAQCAQAQRGARQLARTQRRQPGAAPRQQRIGGGGGGSGRLGARRRAALARAVAQPLQLLDQLAGRRRRLPPGAMAGAATAPLQLARGAGSGSNWRSSSCGCAGGGPGAAATRLLLLPLLLLLLLLPL